jgi:superfamily II DNA or RNA helicase
MVSLSSWADLSSEICEYVRDQAKRCLDAYRADFGLVEEHANIERAAAQGGYGRRQIYELVQNAADAMFESSGRIEVVLTRSALYCANEGDPIDIEGLDAILRSHVSRKRGCEIGRFGMGFKSVLGVSQKPEFFSRSGSFGFDGEFAARLIKQIVPATVVRVPVLRTAKPLDAQKESATDTVLAGLMSWATTVVKLPLDPGCGWLSEDIKNFPSEFLLFASHVQSLRFSDQTAQLDREIRLFAEDNEIHLVEQGRRSRWKVSSTVVRPTQTARADAGELADREELPLSWAVPLDGRPARGKFWAFFPTEYQTTLSGILNAPWKTNEDRWNLLKGEFNSELLSRAAELVLTSLPDLAAEDDPGFVVDVLPARLDESPNWADSELNTKIYALGRSRPCVPDQLGKLVAPIALNIPPSGLPSEALKVWSSYPNRPQDWSHNSLEQRTRRTRLERLAVSVTKPAATVQQWLEALVTDRSPTASIAALKCAAIVHESEPYDDDVHSAHIVLTTDGRWSAADPNHVFLPSEYTPNVPDAAIVNLEVATDDDARGALEKLGIKSADVKGELGALIDSGFSNYSAAQWQKFWKLVAQAGNSAVELLSEPARRGEICVRTLAGDFRSIIRTLLPGAIVPEDASRDRKVAVDTAFHSSHLEVLRAIGSVPAPVTDYPTRGNRWSWAYRNNMITEYTAAMPVKPQADKLVFDRDRCVGPLDVLYELSDEGKSLFSEAVLSQNDPAWTLTHATQKKYPPRPMPAPSVWMVQRQGCLHTSLGVRPVAECFSPELSSLSDFLPIASITLDAAERVGLRANAESISVDEWKDALELATTIQDAAKLGQFYGIAAQWTSVPEEIFSRVGDKFEQRRSDQVTVARSETELDILVKRCLPTILAEPTLAGFLCSSWHLVSAETAIQKQVQLGDPSPPVPALDRFPCLFGLLPRDIDLIACSSVLLDVVTDAGKRSDAIDFYLEGNKAYYAEGKTDRELLGALCRGLELPLTDSDLDRLLDNAGADTEQEAHVERIRNAKTIPEKLAVAIGGDHLQRRLPTSLISIVLHRHGTSFLADMQAGQLALALYGADVLREYRSELKDARLRPPERWAGSVAARTFVRELGFPEEYAGFEAPAREPLIEVPGPPPLRPLHPFQTQIAAEFRGLIRGEGGWRGFISLPTGAGKTRVAVQAIIEAIKEKEVRRPVLWVAQSDELCEQAVQTWSDTWRALGAKGVLHISRLWGSNRAAPVIGDHVVVATIQKLDGCFHNANYDWLRKPGCAVIDEAHTAIAPTYTQLLEWLGFSRDHAEDRWPMVGLSATPFRGNEEESKWLAGRFGHRRLDKDVFSGEPYAVLQDMQVLARVRHELLEGAQIQLTDEELQHFRIYKRIPPSVENRLGADRTRNDAILESILEKDRAWQMLVFATSVEHAQTLAGLLSLAGVPAMAIAGTTDAGVRRFAIEQFRAGKIKVLTNYGVLTQGFDAPAVRALYVTRPTFSPNLYQQMIGRGLRGPLNGGKEECLIVNIADNFLQFGEKLAFMQFEHLWDESARSTNS